MWGLAAAVIPLAMFLLGPALEFVGFGLSEISSAGFIYLAAFFVMRHRGARDLVVAGVLVVLGFYTRLNNLPMAIAVAAFALPAHAPGRIVVARSGMVAACQMARRDRDRGRARHRWRAVRVADLVLHGSVRRVPWHAARVSRGVEDRA